MNAKHYKITCLNCKGWNEAAIIEVRTNEFMIDLNKDHEKHPNRVHIISGRFRGDLNFGWQCKCGNTSILAREEFPQIETLVAEGGQAAMQKLTDSLKVTDAKKFSMVVL